MIIAKTATVKGANCAQIGYQNLIVSSSYQPATAAITPNTYERWSEPSGNMMLSAMQISSGLVDCFGIAAHNLFSAGVTSVPVAVDDSGTGANWVVVATINLIDDGAHFVVLNEPVDVLQVRFEIGTQQSHREVGVLFAGLSMTMEQPIYGGHSPQSLSSVTEYQSTMSDTGQFLGRTITMKGTETSYSWRHLTPEFVYGEFNDFRVAAKTNPMFIKWRPDYYPDDVSYCHTTSDIKPMNMGGGHRLMSVEMSVRGHQD